MRDPSRIEKCCDLFRRLWKKYPDLRFGQLTSIIADRTNTPWFYLEDDQLEMLLKELNANGI